MAIKGTGTAEAPAPIVCGLLKARTAYEKAARCQGLQMRGGFDGAGDAVGYSSKRETGDGINKNKGTQTDYRESETQTTPWEAPYKLIQSSDVNPEVLNLANSTWGHGLPAGMHEIEIIKRMRMKRAWLNVLPPMDCPANIKAREAIISTIEANEWAFREAELQSIMNSRMELMERITENKIKAKEERTCERIAQVAKRLGQQRDKKIHQIRAKYQRELRKLNLKHRGSSAVSYKKRNSDIISKYANRLSEIYTDQRHEALDKTLLGEDYVNGVTKVQDVTNLLPTQQELLAIRPPPGPEDLCSRQTKWTDANLRKLHLDLKTIRLSNKKDDGKEKLSLLKRKFKAPSLPVTPIRYGVDPMDEHLDNSALLIQKIIRGRATQCMMFEGRERCRELIRELQSTHSLEESAQERRRSTKSTMFALYREQNEKYLQDNRICDILDSLEGSTVAGMLDMLNKEDTRLREERKAHAFIMLAERERNRREAEEAGRRQHEYNRREEFDEVFKRIVKVTQDSVQVYLEDIIKESIDWVSEEQAKKYVVELADKIDDELSKEDNLEDSSTHDKAMIADMVHNFLLPEVEKQTMRNKIRDRQQGYLRAAHSAIYREIINIEKQENPDESNQESETLSQDEYSSVGKEEDENESSVRDERELK